MPIEIWAHWLVALCIAVALASGWPMANQHWGGGGLITRDMLFGAHRTAGMLLPFLCLLWVWARLARGPIWRGRSASERALLVYHLALAGAAFVTALLGWAASSAGRFRQDLFGVLPMPNIVPYRDVEFALELYALHKITLWVVVVLASLHIAGALWHWLILRDGVMGAMLTRRAR